MRANRRTPRRSWHRPRSGEGSLGLDEGSLYGWAVDFSRAFMVGAIFGPIRSAATGMPASTAVHVREWGGYSEGDMTMWERVDWWTSIASRAIAIGAVLAVIVSTAGGWAQKTINGYVDGRVERRMAESEGAGGVPPVATWPLDTIIMTEQECTSLAGWVPYGRAAGRVPIGAGSGVDINGVGRVFSTDEDDLVGEYVHTLTVEEMPAHSHEHNRRTTSNTHAGGSAGRGHTGDTATGMTGGSRPHNNMPPSFAMNFCIQAP